MTMDYSDKRNFCNLYTEIYIFFVLNFQLQSSYLIKRPAAKLSALVLDTNFRNKYYYHHFHHYATFLFKTLLRTLQYASVNHTLYGKCVMFPELEGIKMAPNYPVNLSW